MSSRDARVKMELNLSLSQVVRGGKRSNRGKASPSVYPLLSGIVMTRSASHLVINGTARTLLGVFD